jgi:hypothetical protein
LLARVTPALDAFRTCGAEEAWLVDTCGRGGLLRAGEPMRLAVRLDEGLSAKTVTDWLDRLQAALGRVAGVEVAVAPWQRPEMPDEAIEILFAQRIQMHLDA